MHLNIGIIENEDIHIYVFEGYKVHALDYLLKPITLSGLIPCMNHIADLNRERYYIYQNKSHLTKIPYSNILMFSSFKHYIDIITQTSTDRQLIAINKLIKILPNQFIQCHRTIIVNVEHIQKLEDYYAVLSDHSEIPVSRTYIETVQTRFVNSVRGTNTSC